MTELDRALVEIRDIRRQVAANTEFRGHGPATLMATSAIALIAGAVQARWLPDPAAHEAQYAGLWLSTAFLCAALIASQMLARANRLHSGMADEMVRMAVAQFLPAAAAGGILPFALLRVTPIVFWMLPGLWQVIFSLGVFASCRSLPRPMLLAGLWFMLTGFVALFLGSTQSLAPIVMAGPYALGMVLVAAIHYRCARKAAPDEEENA